MARDKREPEEDEGSGYNWMDTYGDLVTLLLCFFVLLFSFSSIDAEKWKALVGAFSGSTPISVEMLDINNVRQNEVIVDGVTQYQVESSDSNNTEEDAKTEQDFDQLYINIKTYIEDKNLDAQLSVRKDNNIIIVRFKDAILFNSGEAQILENAKPILDHVINVLNQNISAVSMIRIEGHTDNVPIHTAQFNSNWELSMARASTALRYFIDSDKIDLKKLSAVAFGEFQPIASNDTAEGRSNNRRVDFLIEKMYIKK